MAMSKAKRVETIVEGPMERRPRRAVKEAGVTRFTVLPVRGPGPLRRLVARSAR